LKENTIAARIHDYIDNIAIIDTHEHFSGNEIEDSRETDFFRKFTMVYPQADLITAGMPMEAYAQLLDISIPVMERWNLVEPYWKKSRFTGHMRCVELAVKEVYGIEEISRDTIEEIDRCLKEQAGKETYKDVFRNKYHIATVLLDHPLSLNADQGYFSPVTRVDPFIMPHCHNEDYWWVKDLREQGQLDSLEKLVAALKAHMYGAAQRGAVAFKMGLADVRPLQFEKASFEDARKAYDRICKRSWINRGDMYNNGETPVREPALENYMMHCVLSILRELKLPLQIHTGMPARNYDIIGYSNPELLNSLFMDYWDVQFDLFHIGYPYQHVMGTLANSFPNVYIDMCWAHIASPVASVRCIREWVASVPEHKVLGFGGDYGHKEIVAGHRRLALQNIAAAMEACVNDGILSVQKAKHTAKAFLYDNPAELFKIANKG